MKITLFKKRIPEGTKTPGQLLDEFDEKFTVDEVNESVELAVLREYLVNAKSVKPFGKDHLIPTFPYSDLLRRHLDYAPQRRA